MAKGLYDDLSNFASIFFFLISIPSIS
jgi:hypothetical protein